jgi:hypothetical protein
MTPVAIIAGARADGILLAVTPDGGLTFKGPRAATDKWVPILKGAKPAIVAHLSRAQIKALAPPGYEAWLECSPGTDLLMRWYKRRQQKRRQQKREV